MAWLVTVMTCSGDREKNRVGSRAVSWVLREETQAREVRDSQLAAASHHFSHHYRKNIFEMFSSAHFLKVTCRRGASRCSILPQPVPCQAAGFAAAAREPGRCAPGVLRESPAIFLNLQSGPAGLCRRTSRSVAGQQVGEAAAGTAGNPVLSAPCSSVLQEERRAPSQLTGKIWAAFFLSK